MRARSSMTSARGTLGREPEPEPQPARLSRSPRMPDATDVSPSSPDTYQRMKVASKPSGRSSVQARRDMERDGPIELITPARSEEHTSELQSQSNLVCRLL